MKKITYALMATVILMLFSFTSWTDHSANVYTVSGKMILLADKCDNIPPGHDDVIVESAASNTTVYIRIAGTTEIVDSITSDKFGNYSISLSEGDYEYVTRWKTKPYIAPSNTATVTWDTACHFLSYREPDGSLYVTENLSDVEITIWTHCPWTDPCCTYTAPSQK